MWEFQGNEKFDCSLANYNKTKSQMIAKVLKGPDTFTLNVKQTHHVINIQFVKEFPK